MSQSEIERFIADLRTDPDLQAAVRQHRDTEGLWGLAQEKGYAFSRSELAASLGANGPDDPAALSDEDLKLVVGGMSFGGFNDYPRWLTSPFTGVHVTEPPAGTSDGSDDEL